MSRLERRSEPQLSESWASMRADEDDDAGSITSEEEYLPPQFQLTASRNEHLRDAMQDDSHSFLPTNHVGETASRNNQYPVQDSTMRKRMRVSENLDSPYSRSGRQQPPEPELRMPSVNASVDFDDHPTFRSRAHVQAPKRTSQQSEVRERPLRTTPKPRKGPAQQRIRSEQTDYLGAVWSNVLAPLLEYVFSVVLIAMKTLKPIIGYGLVVWLLFGGFIFARNLLFTNIQHALTPLCRIPGSGFFNLPFCEQPDYSSPAGPVEFDKLVDAQSAFEDVLTSSAGHFSLPMFMKRSEFSINNLRYVVQYSTLPSRNELVNEFEGFIETARHASQGLTRYNARINRAVDSVIVTNVWTLHTLEDIASKSDDQGSISRFVSNLNILAPFQPIQSLTPDSLYRQYVRHTDDIEEQLSATIFEAQGLLALLEKLDDHLDNVARLAARDGMASQTDRDELLALMWTKLGANKTPVKKMEKNLAILKEVSNQRSMAWAHVASTMVKLQEIAANLEDLKRRIDTPQIADKDGPPLALHIQQVELGLARLTKARDEGRKFREDNVMAILDRED